jgi:hypothetical protein
VTTTTDLEQALARERTRARDLLARLEAATVRAIEAEERARVAEEDRDRYAHLWAQAEAARMALAGEGPFAPEAAQPHDVGPGTTLRVIPGRGEGEA